MPTMILKLRDVVRGKENVTTTDSNKDYSKRFAAGTGMEGYSYVTAMAPFRIIGL